MFCLRFKKVVFLFRGGGSLVLTLFCLIFAFTVPSNAKYEVPESCESTSYNETVASINAMSVTCRVRVLDGDGFNVSSLQIEGTARLHIICNDLLSFESSVPPQINRLTHLEDLVLDSCKILKLSPLTFDGLRELKKLSVNTRNSEWSAGKTLDLIQGSMSGLKELQILDFGSSNIQSVPDDIFCPLSNLQTLNLTRNKFHDVSKIGFASRPVRECTGGYDIRALDLSYNLLRALPDDSGITRLKRLQFLYLQHNEISELSTNALNGLTSLRVLNISNNRLQTVPEGFFASSRELREIYFQNNALYQLSKGLFHHLEQLLVLDLSYNQLSSSHIDDGTFVGLIRLIVLNLSHNALTRIDAKTFKDIFFLQILDLRNNSITFIEDNAFLSLYNLHTLNLGENKLRHIEASLFNGLFVLSKLTLSSNLIDKIDSLAFKNCSDLKELDLSSNALQQVPEALQELSFLKTLDLGENQISGFQNGSFKGLTQLTGLRLMYNNIGNLSKGMFWDLASLQVLNLARNKVQQIERGTFDHNQQLEAIRLDENYLTDINGVFTTLTSLLWLNLSENHLVWFDYAFVPSKLKWLDIHGNFIMNLNNYYNIQSELHIRTLDASHNRITDIEYMSIPNSVEVVFINNNFITSVQSQTFANKTNLIRVDMYANQIVKLDLSAIRLENFPENKVLPEFYLGGNPFHCDCGMEWLGVINNMTNQGQYPRVMDLDNVMCRMTYSRGSAHLSATDAKPSDFLCTYQTHCFAVCHCCDYDACDCKMTCPENCTCYHDQTWSTNIVECSNRRSDTVPKNIPMDATEVYLDGNYLTELENHVFIGRKNMKVLFVNSSHIESIQNRTFTGLTALQTLHLQDNKISELKGYEFEHLVHLRELYLQNNLIAHIANTTLLPLRSLEILRLDRNRLVTFPVWQMTLNTYLVEVSLGDNRWSCRCKFLQELQTWIAENNQKVIDRADIYCYDDDSRPSYKRYVDVNNTACSDYYLDSSVIQSIMVSDYWPMVIVTLSAFVLILFLTLFLFLFREPLKVWVYSKYGVRICFQGAAKHCEDREKLYDGYVCYSPKDEEFVLQSIVAELEHGTPSFQLCLHYRDLPQPSPYMQHSTSPVVVEAAEASKRVILVLSRNFMQTEWSRFEFRQALHEALKGRIFKLVLVEESSSLPEAEMDPDLRPYLKTGARVRWGEKRFWERLRYAMPSGDRHQSKSTNYRRNINNYTLDSSVGNGNHRHAYPEKTKRPHPSSPALQQHVNSHPLFKAAVAANGDAAPPAYSAATLDHDEANYSSATTATPSPRPSHRHHNHHQGSDLNPSRPNSEHIYSSIDSDYSTLERNSVRRANGVAVHRPVPWRAPGSVVDTSGVQSYLV